LGTEEEGRVGESICNTYTNRSSMPATSIYSGQSDFFPRQIQLQIYSGYILLKMQQCEGRVFFRYAKAVFFLRYAKAELAMGIMTVRLCEQQRVCLIRGSYRRLSGPVRFKRSLKIGRSYTPTGWSGRDVAHPANNMGRDPSITIFFLMFFFSTDAGSR
jgi:hypothetical protein